ncbi:MAG: helix-turn-helix domain-containing protein [Halopseudomonas sp.]|uniref:AraC family transcriptional regulator n=1 Tax=Halopseudomonas sp. TaxID=2901191 RepID=UPI0030029091
MTSTLVQPPLLPAWQRNLANFGYRQIAPMPVLAPYVQHYWELALPAGQPSPHSELLHPDGGSSLLFQLAGELQINSVRAQQGVLFSPTAAHSGSLVLAAGVRVFAARFRPGMGQVFWHYAANELAGEVMGLDGARYLRFDLSAVTEQLQLAPDMPSRVALLETALCGALVRSVGMPGALPQTLALLRAARGQQPLTQVLAQTGLGQRQLERWFNRYLGLTAKQFSRLHRVAYSRELLKQAHPDSLAEVAYVAGYSDQAHFSHDFKSVVGLTPGQYLRRVQARYHSAEPADAALVHRS